MEHKDPAGPAGDPPQVDFKRQRVGGRGETADYTEPEITTGTKGQKLPSNMLPVCF